MEKSTGTFTVNWRRTALDKDLVRSLTQRSDLKGFLQTGGFLALLALTGASAFLSAGRLPWPAVVGIVFVHGTVANFLLNGFHELCHGTVFKTRFLNEFFLRVFSFLGWHSYASFRASHMRHHQFTLHPPHDLEVVLPIRFTLKGFLTTGFVNFQGLRYALRSTLRHAFGKFNSKWEASLFPDSDPAAQRHLFNWARILLAGHAIVLAVSIYYRLWMLPVLIVFGRFYGEWLMFLCNNTQHVGLRDNVPDFRKCCRTIYLNPLLRFLYWQMNYHTEHHMYAAVPCYNLRRLHGAIRHDLPPCPDGLVTTWRHIGDVLRKQREDPSFQYDAPVPV